MMRLITFMNLSAIDLNLFAVFHAVLEERSATRAAKRLNVTQSAVSNALARLRLVLGDPLFVRNGRGIVPTRRAEELAPSIAEAIGRLQAAVDRGNAFDPDASTRTFTIAAADNHQAREIPLIAHAFARHLPRARLRAVSADVLAATDGLATGAIDAAFVPAQLVPPGFHALPVFAERAALVVRRDHPRVGPRTKLTPALFNELPHIDVEVALGRTGIGHRHAEQHWQRHGLTRSVAVTVPYFSTAAMIAAQTDCIAGLPSRAAELFCRLLPLRVARATFPLPSIGIVLSWHDRTDADAGARYVRQLVADAVSGH
ncbi:MAG: LysR family transcriptional regulator [Kofleriaceae bacterium]